MSLDLSIVDTVLGSYLKGKDLKAKIDQQKVGNQFRQQQLQQQNQEFEQTLKLHTDQFKAQQEHEKATYGLAAAAAKIQARQAALTTGMGTPGTDAQGNETLTVDSPVAGEAPIVADVTGYRKYQKANTAQAAERAGAVTSAEANAKVEPTIKTELAKVNAQGEQTRKTLDQANTFKAGESAKDRHSRELIASLNGKFHLAGIQAGHNVDDAETNANYASDVLDLTSKLKEVPLKNRGATNNLLRQQGFKAPDSDLKDKLDAFKGLSEALNTGAEVTDRLAKSKTGALGQRLTAATGMTDLGKKIQELQARAGAIVKSPIFANDRGNIALKEVDRALNAFGKGGNTFDEGLERFADVQRAVHGAIDYVLQKYPPQQQHFYKAKLPREILQEINIPESKKAGHVVFDYDDGEPDNSAAQPNVQPTVPVRR